jgi:hypothetical protein
MQSSRGALRRAWDRPLRGDPSLHTGATESNSSDQLGKLAPGKPSRPQQSIDTTQQRQRNSFDSALPKTLYRGSSMPRPRPRRCGAAMERHEVLGTSETGLASLTAERIYFRLRRDLLAADLFCEAAAFAGLAIKNSSGFLPSFVRAVSHFGVAPLPAQVSPFGPRYFGATFMPFLGCDLVALARVRPELHAPPSRRCNCFLSS